MAPIKPKNALREWVRAWWVTLRHGSPLTRSGRELRRILREPDNPDNWIEVERPS